jgi:hypothetical protein
MIALRVNIDPKAMARAVRKLPASKVKEIVKKTVDADARALIKDVISITPPMIGGRSLAASGRAGRAIAARDVKRVFASASYVYKTIHAVSPQHASAFWLLRKKNPERALKFVRQWSNNVLVKNLPIQPVPDPALHESSRNRRGTVPSARALKAIITNEAAMKRYIKQVQKRVGQLAAGWLRAAIHYQIKLPDWITRRASIGTMSFKNTPMSYGVQITNDNKHADADLDRRIRVVAGWEKRQKRIEIRFRHELTAALRAALS